MRTQEQVNEIVRRLLAEYPEAICSLDYGKDYELLFSVRLAAQCTDERVNMVTPALFERFPSLEAFAEADVAEVERYVHSCGFYHAKARDIVNCSIALLEKHGGRVWGSLSCSRFRRCGHPLYSYLQPARSGRQPQGAGKNRSSPPEDSASGELLRFLSLYRIARPCGL